jgi:Icc-related predicted phosphoesterase
MKLLIVSDLHLEFGSSYEPPADGYDVAIIAGDIDVPAAAAVGWAKRMPAFGKAKGVIYVPGNHEFYGHIFGATLEAMRLAAAGTVIHALNCSEVIVDGVRFLGCTLWTDFRLRIDVQDRTGRVTRQSDPVRAMADCSRFLMDYRSVRIEQRMSSGDMGTTCLAPADTLRVHRTHRRWLSARLQQPHDGPTVVVTHHAPHRLSLAPRFAGDWVSAGFVSELPRKFFHVPALWVHGHTHSSFDYRAANCRVVCNPRGYDTRDGRFENAAFKPDWIVEI